MMVIQADCLAALKSVLSNTLDACVTDPPYGLSFMNKHWDYDVPTVELWKEILRVLKPGAHLLCACGTRTQHRMAVNIEDAGFEIRDVITWHYGSGFPKSMDVSKAMDKAAGAEREVIKEGKAVKRMIPGHDQDTTSSWIKDNGRIYVTNETAPATDDAKTWDGWGTALKPATEFWTLARKPLSEKTVVENILKWGVGGINVDGCRVDWDPEALKNDTLRRKSPTVDFRGGKVHAAAENLNTHIHSPESPAGRFPANVILDDFTGGIMDQQSGEAGAFAPVRKGMPGKSKGIYGDYEQKGDDGKSFRGDIVYIAHPISGNVEENLADIRRIVRKINLERPDIVPFVPYYADCVSMDDSVEAERKRGIENDYVILKSGIVDELWLTGEKVSAGMAAEGALAAKLNIRVFNYIGRI